MTVFGEREYLIIVVAIYHIVRELQFVAITVYRHGFMRTVIFYV